jgi:hypothetical protein
MVPKAAHLEILTHPSSPFASFPLLLFQCLTHVPLLTDPAEPHPYGPQIRALIDNPAELLLAAATATPLEKVPSLDEVDYVWVERRDQLEDLAAQLMRVSGFGVDTEQHSQHSFLGYTALLQVSFFFPSVS